jgi:hypothetical protein
VLLVLGGVCASEARTWDWACERLRDLAGWNVITFWAAHLQAKVHSVDPQRGPSKKASSALSGMYTMILAPWSVSVALQMRHSMITTDTTAMQS